MNFQEMGPGKWNRTEDKDSFQSKAGRNKTTTKYPLEAQKETIQNEDRKNVNILMLSLKLYFRQMYLVKVNGGGKFFNCTGNWKLDGV